MSFAPRSLDAISQAVRGGFRQYLPGTDASLRQSVLYVIAKVMTLLAREYELRLEWLYRQLFLRTASAPAIVRMHAADIGVVQRPASPASGTIAGTGAPNITYPAGVRYLSGAATYITALPFTAGALGDFEARVTAETAGAQTNRDAMSVLMLADPGLWPDLSQEATVTGAGLGGGADVEDIEALRRRALRVKASPPQGGTLADYENWALEVPGVAAVWAANFDNGIGSVGAWLLFAARPNGIPVASDLAAVQAHIEDKRLVRGAFYAVAPAAMPVDLTVRLEPDSVTLRAAVTAELAALFDARLPGARLRPGLPGEPFLLPRAWISERISATIGEDAHSLIAPAVDLTFQPGELPVLGAITWIA